MRALHLPDTGRPGASQGRLWRKQILPLGSIDYDGRRITFDGAYLDALRQAFDERAFDQVPLQFADATNTHTDDPERTRGEVVALERTPDGLDALVRLSAAGEATVAENPKLAVSARIVEDLQRADGKRWPKALAHVLATLNPRLTGLRPWARVALNAPDIPVVDLTTTAYHLGGTMPLSDDELATLRALMAKADEPGGPPPGPPAPPSAAAPPSEDGELSDAEVEAILADLLADEGAAEGEPAVAGAALSAEARAAIDLANSRADAAVSQVTALANQAAASQWEARRAAYLDAGVPPVLLDLAAPVLSVAGAPIDLANGPAQDPRVAVTKMLEASKGIVDFSVIGAAETDPVDEEVNLVDSWLSNFGGNA